MRTLTGLGSEALFSFLWLIVALASAFAQAVTWSDLQGMTIEADVHREQTIRHNDRTVSERIHQRWKVSTDSDRSLHVTFGVTVRTPKGTKNAPPNSSKFTLDEVRAVWFLGEGEALWTFGDETLTFTRSLPSGAFRAYFAFARAPSALTCAVTVAFGRQDGKGEIKFQSQFGVGEITILSARQLPSTCKVSRTR
jgi:hypothetical protein